LLAAFGALVVWLPRRIGDTVRGVVMHGLPGGPKWAILGLAVFIFVAGIAFWWTVNNSLPEPQPQGAEVSGEEVAPEIPLDVPLEPEEPVAEQPVLATPEPTVPVLGEPIWPVAGDVQVPFGWYFSDTYQDWRFNPGWQIAAAAGSEVCAVYPGQVITVQADPQVGQQVIVQHAQDAALLYGGLQAVALNPGDFVSASEPLGCLADDPWTGPHLRFQYLVAGQPEDPQLLFPISSQE
jgi:murein DD-endopeptidase MepM/ murein hydrolase activator NlpD